jgi:hypothetical protein
VATKWPVRSTLSGLLVCEEEPELLAEVVQDTVYTCAHTSPRELTSRSICDTLTVWLRSRLALKFTRRCVALLAVSVGCFAAS